MGLPGSEPAMTARRQPLALASPGAPGVVEPEAIHALVWPRRAAASVGLTLLLTAGLAIPVVTATQSAVLLVGLAAPLAVIGYVTRLVFEALVPHTRAR